MRSYSFFPSSPSSASQPISSSQSKAISYVSSSAAVSHLSPLFALPTRHIDFISTPTIAQVCSKGGLYFDLMSFLKLQTPIIQFVRISKYLYFKRCHCTPIVTALAAVEWRSVTKWNSYQFVRFSISIKM